MESWGEQLGWGVGGVGLRGTRLDASSEESSPADPLEEGRPVSFLQHRMVFWLPPLVYSYFDRLETHIDALTATAGQVPMPL
jgi:hypothetical protein